MVAKEILQCVFFLKCGGQSGTCFLVSINNSQFYITARHIFPDKLANKSAIDVEIYQNSKWNIRKVIYLIHANSDIDIAVLDLNTKSTTVNPFELGGKSYFLSQDTFFLGFPYGLKMEDNIGLNNGFPIPFVKKGIISSFITDASKVTKIFLDGHNNPGFSGGPVVIWDNGSGGDIKMRIIGIISAYIKDYKIFSAPIGSFRAYENSGIVLSFHFDHVYEII